MSDLPPLAISAALFCRAPPRQGSRRGLFVSNARNSTNCPYRDESRSEPWTWFSILGVVRLTGSGRGLGK
jgi:hypothetical protein